jgi:hypothetical protein
MTLIWFVVWAISDWIGDAEPLRFDPSTGGPERCC